MKRLRLVIIVVMCFVCISLCACDGAQSQSPFPSGDNGAMDIPSGSQSQNPLPSGDNGTVDIPSGSPSDTETLPDETASENPEYVTPVVRIDVEGKQTIESKEEYLPATVTLTDDTGTVTLDGVSAGVRGRGNYSWTLPKKGYRIKFDKKQAMLSDYKCKSWAILPNYTDKTLLRNYYAFQCARAMDGFDWASDAKLIEVYLNDEYLGVYLLCDQTQVDENRVNVEEDSEDADTGFLLERDRYALSDPTLEEGRDYFTIETDHYSETALVPYVLKSPEYPDKSDYKTDAAFEAAVDVYMAQFEYIKEYVTNAFNAAYNANYSEFEQLCDVNSFADYFILDQVLCNWEIDRYSSFYLHKDKGGKLVAGPVWDYDLVAGYMDEEPESEFYYANSWFISLALQSPEFRKLYAERLAEHTPIFISELQKLAAVADKNREAIERNNVKWPVEEYVYPMGETLQSLKTYDEQLDYFVEYVTTRVDWLNTWLESWL